jgi:YD repeat-containing protein
VQIRFGPAIIKVSAVFLLFGPLVQRGALASDAEDDAICFPLYRDTGAIPGAGLPCEIDASTASVGMSTYFCTGTPEIIERYCGTVIDGPSCPSASFGNPIDTSTGNKYQTETDYIGTGLFPLKLQRTYNSNSSYAWQGGFGALWRMSYDRKLTQATDTMAYVARHDGRIYYFTLSGDAWTSTNAHNKDKLVQLKDTAGATTGWTYTSTTDEAQETYDKAGRLLEIKARNGQTQKMTLSTAATPASVAPGPNYLIKVSDHFGRSLSFTWNSNGTLATVKDPANGLYSYAYDADRRLTKVSFPSATTTVDSKTYLYNEPAYTAGNDSPTALTGIQDENGNRFATFNYDLLGRANGTEHAAGADKFSMVYSPNQTVVTDPLGTARTYKFARVAGALRLSGVNQPGGAGCAAAANGVTYDANGNLKSTKDFNGVTTTYVFNQARNLETSRIEAAGTAQARTTTTSWHPSYRLPSRVAEPKRLTVHTYFPNGDLSSKTVYPTADLTGALGLGVTLGVKPLKSTFTYDTAGRLLTASLPAEEGRPSARLSYVWEGANLSTITNALGHASTFSNYDAHGRPGKVLEADGVSTSYVYSARGWLLEEAAMAGSQTRKTVYTYDPVGLLKSVAAPGQAVISFDYDSAHRLKEVRDSLGNKISYELDAAGNRTGEKVLDASGVLVRQASRVFDALNRVQNVTGAAQ